MCDIGDDFELERLLAITLARVEDMERERTAMNLRMLDLEAQRDVALDERDAANARAQNAKHTTSQALRQQAAQASVDLRNIAHSLKSAGRTKMAHDAEERAAKLVEALR